MKLSPVQLIESHPMKISVEYNPKSPHEDDFDLADGDINLEHIAHVDRFTRQEIGAAADDDRVSYFLMLGVRSSDDAEIQLPYSFEVVITGVFAISPWKFDTKANIDDLAAQYGFSMLYGQICETVTSLTSRMRRGALVLPTMSFMDAKYDECSRF